MLDRDTVRSQTLATLGTPEVDMVSAEALGALLRRTAGLYCPCSPSTLVRVVETALDGLADPPYVRDRIKEALTGLLAYGDLQEHEGEQEPGLPRCRLVYATPPTFVVHAKTIYLVGVAPEQPAMVPEALERDVHHEGYTRWLEEPEGSFEITLRDLGLGSLPHDLWLWTPPPEAPDRFMVPFDQRLDRAGPVGAVPDLEIFDPTTSVRFYRGRRTEPRSGHTGRFVARRSQLFGASLWSYVELDAGRPTRLIDLPIAFPNVPPGFAAWDQAWRLQAAIDRLRGYPQLLRRRTEDSQVILDLFAPPPGWLQRRWSVLGRQIPREQGALFSFAFSPQKVDDELEIAANRMWLEIT